MKLAPITLFVYNRPIHTRHTLEALAKNILADESSLFIFADGPKKSATKDELSLISEVRKVIRGKKWCKKVTIIEKETNNGLAKSIITGINYILKDNTNIIILEDDIITSPGFLKYMNEALGLYKNTANVYSVNAYMFPVEWDKAETVLLPYISTWGWGTWKEKWSAFNFEMDEKEIILSNLHLKARFNMADYPFTSMLHDGNNSWGIRWYYSVFIRNGLGVFPTKSLIENIGFDGSGVNCNDSQQTKMVIESYILVQNQLSINLKFYSTYLNYFKNQKRFGLKNKLSIVRKKIRKVMNI